MRLGRTLIIIALAIAVLGTVYYFALKYEPPAEKTEIPEESSITIFETNASDVIKISVTNPSGSFTFIKDEAGWKVSGKDYIILTSSVDTYVYSFSRITASNIIEENAVDLYVYGLSQPQAEVSVTTSDGEASFIVGAADPTGNYYYFAQKDSAKVYTVSRSSADAYFRRLNSFRDMTVTNIDIHDVRGINVKTPDRLFSVVYSPLAEGESNEYGVVSVWKIQSPIKAEASNQKLIESVITPACGITASDIVEDNPADLSKYALNTEFTVVLENGEEKFRVGTANGAYYIYPEGSISVYSVSRDAVAFTEVTAFDVMQKFVALHNIDTVAKIEYSSNGAQAALEKNGDSYSINGAHVSKEAYTASFQNLIGLLVDGIANKGYDTSACVATLRFTFTDKSVENIAFYDYDDLNYAVVKDGEFNFYIKKTKLAELDKSLK